MKWKNYDYLKCFYNLQEESAYDVGVGIKLISKTLCPRLVI